MKKKIVDLKLEKIDLKNASKIVGGQIYYPIDQATNCGSTPRNHDDCG